MNGVNIRSMVGLPLLNKIIASQRVWRATLGIVIAAIQSRIVRNKVGLYA